METSATAVSLDDLQMAMDWVSDSGSPDSTAYVSRETGKVHWVSDEIDDELEEIPDDIDDADRYVEVPRKQDLDLGRRLVLKFVGAHLPDSYEQVDAYFHKRGAYGKFKDLLIRKGMLDAWHEYENQAVENELREWAKENGLTVQS